MASQPERFGHYTVERLIGRGGMALVYAARNERTGADVALKVVVPPPDGADDTDATIARFKHEADISGRLVHPNIVRIYDFLTTEAGEAVLVMERLRGESLAAILQRRGKLEVGEALAVLFPVLRALAHTHAQGVIHRDVKASNVFLAVDTTGAVTPKLLDFGIAKRPGSSPSFTARDEVLGTPSAMSPEQIRGGVELDPRSDVFSCAAMAIELLTGRGPFHAASAAASLVAVLEREVDPTPEIAPRLFVELERALRKAPLERHASAAELELALREACPDESAEGALSVSLASIPVDEGTPTRPSHAESGGLGRHSLRRPRSRLTRVGGATLVTGGVVLALVSGAVFALARGDHRDAQAPSPSAPASAAAPTLARAPAPPQAESAASSAAAASTVMAPSAPSTAPPPPPPKARAAPKAAPKVAKPVATRPDF
ncbi:MAG TPA: serine/threonine-protein kinase [Polyangiaceae bacterium]|nr:serine/threonine-protein kinase [Polyangiaceae bacterium]